MKTTLKDIYKPGERPRLTKYNIDNLLPNVIRRVILGTPLPQAPTYLRIDGPHTSNYSAHRIIEIDAGTLIESGLSFENTFSEEKLNSYAIPVT